MQTSSQGTERFCIKQLLKPVETVSLSLVCSSPCTFYVLYDCLLIRAGAPVVTPCVPLPYDCCLWVSFPPLDHQVGSEADCIG